MNNTIEQIFVDGIANLTFSGGVFRFDLATIKPTQNQKDVKNNKMAVDSKAQIIMTPQAFMQTMKSMERFIKLVEEKGVIRFNEHPAETEPVAAD